MQCSKDCMQSDWGWSLVPSTIWRLDYHQIIIIIIIKSSSLSSSSPTLFSSLSPLSSSKIIIRLWLLIGLLYNMEARSSWVNIFTPSAICFSQTEESYFNKRRWRHKGRNTWVLLIEMLTIFCLGSSSSPSLITFKAKKHLKRTPQALVNWVWPSSVEKAYIFNSKQESHQSNLLNRNQWLSFSQECNTIIGVASDKKILEPNDALLPDEEMSLGNITRWQSEKILLFWDVTLSQVQVRLPRKRECSHNHKSVGKSKHSKLFLEDHEHHVTGVTLPIYLMLVA